MDEEAVRTRAGLLLESGRPREALVILAGWLGQHPDSPAALTQACMAHRLLGENVEAVEIARRAARLVPDDDTVMLVLADALLGAGRTREADAIAVNLVRRHPDDPGTHQLAARAALRLGLAGEIRALLHARRTVQLAPNDPLSHVLLARVLGWQGRVIGSRQAAVRARKLAPVDTSVRRSLAAVDLEGFQPAAAAEGFSVVLRDSPGDRMTVRLLASSLIRAAMLAALALFALLLNGGAIALVVESSRRGYDPEAPADLAASASVALRVAAALAVVCTAVLWGRGIRNRRHLLGRWVRLSARSVSAVLTYLLLIAAVVCVVMLAAGGPAGLYPGAIGATLLTMTVGAIGRAVVRRSR
ncbi:Flp pilus assembly protein TadD [Nakamurella sp. UYEF19]|uniref:tetratricopeptide repeat protein n=1 Tax=Nakamurella sp. UYEF19 TaxID=1756392 RepID=UPI00339AD062